MSASGWFTTELSDRASATSELDELEPQPTLKAESERDTDARMRRAPIRGGSAWHVPCGNSARMQSARGPS
jgi:hypothetical protein